MGLAGNKAKRLLSVNHTTKTIHHHHHPQKAKKKKKKSEKKSSFLKGNRGKKELDIHEKLSKWTS